MVPGVDMATGVDMAPGIDVAPSMDITDRDMISATHIHVGPTYMLGPFAGSCVYNACAMSLSEQHVIACRGAEGQWTP